MSGCQLQHLLSPYIGVLLPHIEELLPAYDRGEIDDVPLWTLLLEVLGKSFEVDDGCKSSYIALPEPEP